MIQTSQYNIDKQNCEKKVDNFERKIHDVSGLVTTAVCNAKMGVVESKIPSVIDLVKKPVYDAKTSDFQEKHFTTSDYNRPTNDILAAKMKEKGIGR